MTRIENNLYYETMCVYMKGEFEMLNLLANPELVKKLGVGMTMVGAVCNMAGNHLGKVHQDAKVVEAAKEVVNKMDIPKMVEEMVSKRMRELGK